MPMVHFSIFVEGFVTVAYRIVNLLRFYRSHINSSRIFISNRNGYVLYLKS